MWGVLQEYKVMGPLLRAISTTEVPPGGLHCWGKERLEYPTERAATATLQMRKDGWMDGWKCHP